MLFHSVCVRMADVKIKMHAIQLLEMSMINDTHLSLNHHCCAGIAAGIIIFMMVISSGSERNRINWVVGFNARQKNKMSAKICCAIKVYYVYCIAKRRKASFCFFFILAAQICVRRGKKTEKNGY